jgi:hypothetical protein
MCEERDTHSASANNCALYLYSLVVISTIPRTRPRPLRMPRLILSLLPPRYRGDCELGLRDFASYIFYYVEKFLSDRFKETEGQVGQISVLRIEISLRLGQ